MTVFFTSDHHFNHKRIVELSDRPFKATKDKQAWEVMNEGLIKRWNETVAPDDKVYHLGDMALGNIDDLPPILEQLNGEIVWLAGNHDRHFHLEKRRNGRTPEEWAEYILSEWGIIAVMGNVALAGFDDNEPVMMSHFPYTGDHSDGDRFEDARAVDSGLPIVHGHTHSDKVISYSAKGTLQIHVGVDTWNYRPVSYRRITEIIRALDTSRNT